MRHGSSTPAAAATGGSVTGPVDCWPQACVAARQYSAAAASDEDGTSEGVVGTVNYISPEQIRNQPLDGRTDVYALGCVAFHMLTGTVPFGSFMVKLERKELRKDWSETLRNRCQGRGK